MPTRRGRPDVVVAYGGVTAVAVVTGDWDGNGSHTIGVVYARSDGQLEWQLRNANTAGAPDVVVRFGGTSSIPVIGDWDGNGTTTIDDEELVSKAQAHAQETHQMELSREQALEMAQPG
jgi:hypothetical protein